MMLEKETLSKEVNEVKLLTTKERETWMGIVEGETKRRRESVGEL